jgi:predicted O-methyltransferase YrrM
MALTSLALVVGLVAALAVLRLLVSSVRLQRAGEKRLTDVERQLHGVSKAVVEVREALQAARREAGAAAEAAGAKLEETVGSLAGRLEALHPLLRHASEDAAANRALLLDAARDTASRHQTLMQLVAASAAATDPSALREAEDRSYFQGTLATARIRPLQLAQLFPGIDGQAVEIGVIDPDTKHPNHVDMLYVCAIARHVRARRVFEFGTYPGRTTFHLARGEHVQAVYTLDLDPASSYPADLKIGRAVKAVHERQLQGHFFRTQEAGRLVTQLHGDSRTFDYAPYRESMDLVFVDGGHTYDLVVNDTVHAFSILAPGGVIVWHDFAPKGRDVTTFARELSKEHPLFWIQDTSLLVYLDGVDSMTFEAASAPYARSVIKPA